MKDEQKNRATPVLGFRDVVVELGRHRVLAGLSFEVSPGEIVGLVGHNGAGKTTLLRAATRVLALGAGEITLDGRSIDAFSRRELARVMATVPQDTQIPFPFCVEEVVLMGRAPHQPLFGLESPEDIRLARDAMQRLGIEKLAGLPIQALSGGERQLVMFARALTQAPGILLLDEPTAFLDLRHRIDVLMAVREMVNGGGSALVVSHDLGLAARVCDRLVVLREGAIVAQGPGASVLTAAVLSDAFGIEADILEAPDGSTLVVPRLDGPSSC